jgi:uncharacterized protein YggE
MRLNKMYAGLFSLALVPNYGAAGPCTSVATNSISVSGSSSQRLRPDRVSFSVGVLSNSPSVADAFKAASTRVNAVLAALKSKGVTPEELQTSSFNISTVVADKARPRTFTVETLITITRSDTSTVGNLLQAAVDAGANQAGSLRFFVADANAVRQRGLERAFEDARAKAQVLAELSKRTIGDVLCISDELGNAAESDWRDRLQSLGYVAAAEPAIESGLEEVTFHVSVVFALK